MGNADFIYVLFLLPNMVTNKVTISDVVTTDTSFYYRRFQTFPSKLATLEYSVMFNLTKVKHQRCAKGCNVILDIYTTECDKNLNTNCSKDGFGQLRNENLWTPLHLRYHPYRFTICKLDQKDSDMLHCEGRTTIQDYIPRKYGFSFGYECHFTAKPLLVGLWYNFTISEQTNNTQCLLMEDLPENMKECLSFYNHMSLPNMIGHHDMDSIRRYRSNFHVIEVFISYISLQLPTGGCYKHMKEVICRVVFPQCDHSRNQMLQICKETCFLFLNSCLKFLKQVLHSYLKNAPFEHWRKYADKNISDEVDCNYLPSLNDSIPCYYKPVTCDPPPNVTNARIINGSEHDGTYLAKFQVEYECVNETFQMEGNSTVTCLYSGEWYKIPKCLKRKREKRNDSTLNPLSIVIPLLTAPFYIFIITYRARRYICRTKKSLLLKRNKEYHAFVCYNFDEDNLFVFNSILPELEENHDPPLKIFIHDRDFTPGRDITINICNAINNCNSAIIVMSQGFIDSPRCREEFTKCLAESEENLAFKLFIILMEEVDTLINIPENMQIFLKEKTYVKRNDPKLFEKIGYHLWLMRQHDKPMTDDKMEQKRLFENQDEA